MGFRVLVFRVKGLDPKEPTCLGLLIRISSCEDLWGLGFQGLGFALGSETLPF